jgi:putative transposase
MICVDGGPGLRSALPTVYPGLAVQRCWAHKLRNILNKVRKADQPAVKRGVLAVPTSSAGECRSAGDEQR